MPDTVYTPADHPAPDTAENSQERKDSDEGFAIEVSTVPQMSYAHVQNGTHLITQIQVTNNTARALEDLTLELVTRPGALLPATWHLSSLPALQTVEVPVGRLHPDLEFLDRLNETERGNIEFTLRHEDQVLARDQHSIEVLARNHWGGMATSSSLLAAFVGPNDPSVVALVKRATEILKSSGNNPSLRGYKDEDRERVTEILSAIWSAICELSIGYSLHAPSFETHGQKVRLPDQIRARGLANCLDMSVLFASAIEYAGFDPVVVVQDTELGMHAYTGVWLEEQSAPSVVITCQEDLRKAMTGGQFVAFECTLATSNSTGCHFPEAMESGEAHLAFEDGDGYFAAVDIARAREAGIKPMASTANTGPEDRKIPRVNLSPGKTTPLRPKLRTEETARDETGRLDQWRKKLLDLSLRNSMLNHDPVRQGVALHCVSPDSLVDQLSGDEALRLKPLEEISVRKSSKSAGAGTKPTAKLVNTSFAKGELLTSLSRKELDKRTKTLARKSRSDLAERGLQSLFLAVGFLRWKKNVGDRDSYLAPLVFVPVALERRSTKSEYKLRLRDDELLFNETLVEFLQRDFELALPVPSFSGDRGKLAEDVENAIETVRSSVHEVAGLEIVEAVSLGAFSFTKHNMWHDLGERAASLGQSRFVNYLMESPPIPYSAFHPDQLTFSGLENGSSKVPPLMADATQSKAIHAVADGKDVVIVGPPGTGKSQTVANIIAQSIEAGRKVLFVAEKPAAHEVVLRRLDALGLTTSCLALYTGSQTRKDVIEQLAAAWTKSAYRSEASALDAVDAYNNQEQALALYTRSLLDPDEAGVSVGNAIGHVLAHDAPFELELEELGQSLPGLDDLEAFCGRAAEVFDHIKACAHLELICVPKFTISWRKNLEAAAIHLMTAATDLEGTALDLARSFAIPIDNDVSSGLLDLLDALNQLPSDTAAFEDVHVVAEAFDSFQQSDDRTMDLLGRASMLRGSMGAQYASETGTPIPLDDFEKQWREAQASFWPASVLAQSKVRRLLHTYSVSGTACPQTDIPALQQLRQINAELAQTPISGLNLFDGLDTDPSQVAGVLEASHSLRDILASQAADESQPKTETRLDPDADLINAYSRSRTEFEVALVDFNGIAGGDLEFGSLSDVRDKVTGLGLEMDLVPYWIEWGQVRQDAEDNGLSSFCDALTEGQIGDPIKDFRAAFFQSWLPQNIDGSDVLGNALKMAGDNEVARLARSLRKARAECAQEIAFAASTGLPEVDSVARNSSFGILRHQMGLKRPSLPIRNLMEKIPDVVQTVTPCVMMSPMTAAQYLPADFPEFDLVVFDEASQITPWDAVGALSRGKQAVIVGDPQQLPPTRFFERSFEEPEGQELHESDLGSVLDEAMATGLPACTLDWHYRSRDEGLIAFSNQHYYENRLLTFPSVARVSSALRLHSAGGTYGRGRSRTNPVEAKLIVRKAVGLMEEWALLPEADRPTLGIITFNAPQQELIQDLLEQERADNQSLNWFFDDARVEPVIVRNLENIQGDERDVILFSVTFGPDSTGKVAMTFGALSAAGGEKRLNVAITRARSEMHVFASLRPGDIDPERTNSRGAHHLRAFLEFAATRPGSDQRKVGDGSPSAPNAFAEAVATALEARGWQVRRSLGTSGLGADLAIEHPHDPEVYLAAILTDQTAEDASVSVTDLYVTRDQVLTNLGWTTFRIWSLQWYLDPAKSLDRLDAQLRHLRDASSHRHRHDYPIADDGQVARIH
ncbi:DUF4011 domain-containing protein [Alisedimentitalea sp. MJ-SS2]|uniref:DUF4011 domain-containing protein n=1 Tax=Aliisedimentitalea sp. MJ-SS2 TaxID=3049795 RepID=UPI00290C1CDF|nr:DUF4011 domain-containing protein [Alisedimentitalea sp. MJ-SS2]MDU8930052.1 DUF4011 domain-containing protein [Alisedimentitalea sp. MJ-SS2]